MDRFSRSLAVGLLLVSALLGRRALQGDAGRWPGQAGQVGVPRLATSQLQFEHAARLKQGAREKAGREREERRELAVAAYRAVRVYFPEDCSRGAEAAFRAGELLRAAGQSQRALEEFRSAHALGRSTAFRTRAALEIGHVLRRSGEAQPALDAYLALALDADAEPRAREEATLWAGRVHAERGDADEARRLWQRLAEAAEDPVHRVEAFDELALQLADVEDLEGAAGVLERARAALSDVALEDTAQGERVRGALEGMRSIAHLQKKVAERARRVRIGGGR